MREALQGARVQRVRRMQNWDQWGQTRLIQASIPARWSSRSIESDPIDPPSAPSHPSLRRRPLHDALDYFEHDRRAATHVRFGQALVVSVKTTGMFRGNEERLIAVTRDAQAAE